MMTAFEAWTIQLSKVNEPSQRGYQTARAYAIQVDYPPPHTPMKFLPPHAPMGPAYYQPGRNYQQYPCQGLGLYLECDELGQKRTFCPDMRTDQEHGELHPNDCGRLTITPRGGNGGEISAYRPERRLLLSMWEYALVVARQGQQEGGVATTAATQPPQPQHVAWSQLFQQASIRVTAFRSGIAWQLSDIDRYNSDCSTRKEGKEEHDEDHINQLSNEGAVQEDGQGDSSGEEEEDSEMEEEGDSRLDEEARQTKSDVVCTHTGYAMLDARWNRIEDVTRCEDKWAHIEEAVPAVLTSAGDQGKQTISNVVAFSKQPANTDPIVNRTSMTPLAPKVLSRKAPALDTGNYKVQGSCQLDDSTLASQERETSELTFRLSPKAETVSVYKDKRVAAWTLAWWEIIGVTHVSAISSMKDYARYTEFRYTRSSPTILGKIHVHKLLMFLNGGTEICLMGDVSLERWTSGGNAWTGQWLRPMAIFPISQKLQSLCPSMSMVSSFPSQSC